MRGDPMADDEEEDEGASSTMAHALALTEDSDFGEMEVADPEVGGAKLSEGRSQLDVNDNVILITTLL